ncbi:DMT family transporter [Microvirga rosea]|uniref:DMT family transporter n=1 Tax=Microvirga rosea TaxID=2715425 RepID=UPI001D0A3443|nr:DMT family transporter [Microvirga rosea]MCB8821182.1 DMT family transporter [Microvirga rosea]
MKPLLGISLKILSAFVFTLMSAGLKTLSSVYPVGELVFFRCFFALIPLLTWLAWQGDLINAVRTEHVAGHFLRGLIGTSSMYLGFAALAYLPLHDTIAIGYASPLIVVILAALLLKEKVRAYRWTAVGIGFVGVLIMLSPFLKLGSFSGGLGAGSSIGAFFSLMGAVCSAGATIQVRRLTQTERTGAIVFYFFILASGLSLLTIPLGWVVPSLSDLLLFILVGILGGIGQILLTQSYRFADTSILAPFEYTTMIWALLLGWFVFGDLPTAAVMSGAAIVAGTGLFIVWRERKLGLERAKALETAAQRPGG